MIDKLKSWALMKLMPFLFEKGPLKFLDGYKLQIGRVVSFLAVLIGVTQSQEPEIAQWLHFDQINTYVTLVVGWLGIEIGSAHDKSKEIRGL